MASLEGVNDEEKDNDDEENKNNVEEEISSYISSWPLDQFLSSVFHQFFISSQIVETLTRDQRVAVFNFGTDRVRVLEKTSGSG